ncbi:MAG: alkaline phosphatase [Planctomycetaceae bacterium]|nr:MAG: alkaline phosphatase [Planctomycetaceae bacterium]
MQTRTTRIWLIGLTVVCLSASSPRFLMGDVKNVILMIGDGAGYNHWIAASMYQGRWDAQRGQSTQVYDGDGWIEVGCSTHPLNLSDTPQKTDVQDRQLIYAPAKAWDPQTGYDWLNRTFTDSAAAGTALATGVKTYNNAINWSDLDRPILPTIAHIAAQSGRSAGVVTSVQWSHATPAALGGARSAKRNDYETIANQMIQDGILDVIMGAGHPDFDDDGRPVTNEPTHRYVGGKETWEAIEAARATPDGTYHGLRPVSTNAEFQSLLSGETPRRVLGTAQVARTLQYSRKGRSEDENPYDTPRLTNVPTLAQMTQGALNVLGQNPRGLWLMVEGGAIDWAGHDNQGARMIEEQVEFVEAIEAVVQWIEANSDWDETLLILTADHETGLVWGPDSAEEEHRFQPIVDQGPGQMPLLRFHSKEHTNSLVPVFAKGRGARWLVETADRTDPVRGPYLDNTDVFHVMAKAVSGPVVAPAEANP